MTASRSRLTGLTLAAFLVAALVGLGHCLAADAPGGTAP